MIIRANCRAQFTETDFRFVSQSLGLSREDDPHLKALEKLLADPQERDAVLDENALYEALVDHPHFLTVSHYFYFYILVRHVLLRMGIDDREVADYLGAMLAAFARAERLNHPVEGGRSMEYLFEMLEALDQSDDTTRFMIRSHMGNYALFMVGMFPDRIRERCQRQGAPHIAFYEELGRNSFKAASHHRLAQQYDLGHIYETLGETFRQARQALNDMSERVLFTGAVEGENGSGLVS